jgi:hypothetical protein
LSTFQKLLGDFFPNHLVTLLIINDTHNINTLNLVPLC